MFKTTVLELGASNICIPEEIMILLAFCVNSLLPRLATSPDLTPPDFFCWSSLEKIVYWKFRTVFDFGLNLNIKRHFNEACTASPCIIFLIVINSRFFKQMSNRKKINVLNLLVLFYVNFITTIFLKCARLSPRSWSVGGSGAFFFLIAFHYH